MTRKMRGYCLVIDIETFNNDIHEQKFRDGSAVDSRNIRALFQDFGFTVIMKKNLTYNEVSKSMDDFVALHKNIEVDMSAVFVMSHGLRGSIKSPDGIEDHGTFVETSDNRKVTIKSSSYFDTFLKYIFVPVVLGRCRILCETSERH